MSEPKSPAEELLELLKDPFKQPVRFPSRQHFNRRWCAYMCIVNGWCYLVRFGYIAGHYPRYRSNLLLRPTLQYSHLCSQTEACRRETCTSTHREGILRLDISAMAHNGERSRSPCRYGCCYLHTDHEYVQKHLSDNRRTGECHTSAHLLDEELRQGSYPEVVFKVYACERLE